MPTLRTASGRPLAVVVCIADAPEERVRIAGQFDGVGVLVMASDADSASAFLGTLCETPPTSGGPAGGQAPGSGKGPSAPASGRAPDEPEVICVGGLRLDLADHEAAWLGRGLDLTPHEFRVLATLAGRPGRVWTYQQLYDQAWERPFFTGPVAVQSVVKRLRAKFRSAGVPVRVDAARGLGFRLVAADE